MHRDRVVSEGNPPSATSVNPLSPSSNIPSAPSSPSGAYVATLSDQFNAALEELEDNIVTMFSQGASLSMIHRRYPTYPPSDVGQLLMRRLAHASLPLDLLPGMQIMGFNDDLACLSLLIEDKHCDPKDKLKAVELRTKTRQALIQHLQDQDLLKKPVRDGGVHEEVNPNEQRISSVVINFEKLQTPEERQKYIECLNNGVVYTPESEN